MTTTCDKTYQFEFLEIQLYQSYQSVGSVLTKGKCNLVSVIRIRQANLMWTGQAKCKKLKRYQPYNNRNKNELFGVRTKLLYNKNFR